MQNLTQKKIGLKVLLYLTLTILTNLFEDDKSPTRA